MSHIVTIKTEVRDAAAVGLALSRLRLAPPREGVHRLFGGEVAGLAIDLPEWRYPVVCNTATGDLRYDNYGGRWGDQKHLDAFLQRYAVETAKAECRRKGHSVTEQQLDDGSIKLTVQVTGGAA